MSEDVNPAQAGWYLVPRASAGPKQVGYWDGAAWTGAPRRASGDGRQPRDTFGTAALILLGAGFVGTILVPVGYSLATLQLNLPEMLFTVAMIIVLAASPAALAVSILGLVRGRRLKFLTPLSLSSLILATLGTVLLALPIALFVTGVWILPHF